MVACPRNHLNLRRQGPRPGGPQTQSKCRPRNHLNLRRWQFLIESPSRHHLELCHQLPVPAKVASSSRCAMPCPYYFETPTARAEPSVRGALYRRLHTPVHPRQRPRRHFLMNVSCWLLRTMIALRRRDARTAALVDASVRRISRYSPTCLRNSSKRGCAAGPLLKHRRPEHRSHVDASATISPDDRGSSSNGYTNVYPLGTLRR